MRQVGWVGVLLIAACSSFWMVSASAEEPRAPSGIEDEESDEPAFVDFHEITAEFTRRWGLAADSSDERGLPGIAFVKHAGHETPARYVARIRKAQKKLDARVQALPPDGVPVTLSFKCRLPHYQSPWGMFVLSLGPVRGGRLYRSTGQPFVTPWLLRSKPECGKILIAERGWTFTYCVPPGEAGRLAESSDRGEINIGIHLLISPRDDKLSFIVGTPARKDWEAHLSTMGAKSGPDARADEQLFFKPSFAIAGAELFDGEKRLASFRP
jgi:hypothetical protein